MKKSRWLSLQGAADMLGVHTSTLRRWAEEGVVVHTVTAGGHRRFDVQELERFLARQSRGAAPGADGSNSWAHLVLAQTRREVATHGDAHWLRSLNDAARERHRLLGRRLMGLTLQFVSSESEEESALLDEARAIGLTYAQLSRSEGVSLRDALEAALFFRDRLLEASWELPAGSSDRRLDRRINVLLNMVQLGMAEGYE